MARTGSKGRQAAKPASGRATSRKARTAGGKKADPSPLAAAPGSQEGLRARTEAGHLAAGRTPPSQVSAKRMSGATRVVDDDIRSYGLTTEDQKLLESPKTGADFTRTDPWRVM